MIKNFWSLFLPSLNGPIYYGYPVTAFTDHQALTYLQQLKASKLLRGLTAHWLDFLAEFPDLTITYLPGVRNQVADACHASSSSAAAAHDGRHHNERPPRIQKTGIP